MTQHDFGYKDIFKYSTLLAKKLKRNQRRKKKEEQEGEGEREEK